MPLPLLAHGRGMHGETVGGTRFFGITIPALLREVYRGCHCRRHRTAQQGIRGD